MFYIDPTYLYLMIIMLVISTGAQLFIKSSYSKWSKVQNGSGLTGEHIGYAIVNRTDLGGCTRCHLLRYPPVPSKS